MSINIKELCKQIIDETTAIVAYTDSIDTVKDNKLKAIFTEIRGDELSHLQKHVVALTEILHGDEPTVAEQMDEEGEEDGENENEAEKDKSG